MISGFITGFETDYPLQLANKGVCLNLDHVFDQSNEIGQLITKVSQMKEADDS